MVVKEKFIFKSEELRKAREEKHYSQAELANLVFTTRQSISNWENGKKIPTLENVNKLSEVLNIPLEELIVRKEEEKQSTNEEQRLANYNNINYTLVCKPTIDESIKKSIKDLKFIKIIALLILALMAIYLICSIRKFCILNDIMNKMSKYYEINNYHIAINYYEVINANKVNEYVENIYYMDDMIKIECQAKDGSKKETTYISGDQEIIMDLTNNTYKIAEKSSQDSNFIIDKMISSQVKTFLHNIICSLNFNLKISNYIAYDLNYNFNNYLGKSKINERISKETGLLEEKTIKIDEDNYTKTQFEITMNSVTIEDVTLPNLDDYILK